MIVFVLTQIAWAYGQVLTKSIIGVNSIQINIHLGIFLIFFSGLMYPQFVVNPVPREKLIMNIFVGGFFMAISQIIFIGAITITRNTGVLTMFMFVSVIVGYLISVLRYNEEINPICTIGSILIIIGLSKIVLKEKTPVKE